MRDLAGGHRRRRHPGRLRDARRSSTSRVGVGVVWILRRLRAARRSSAPSAEATDACTCYELPLVFVLVGLVLYAVLGGADFGAGIWQLAAGRGRRRRADPRPRPRRDGAGLGGQPRLADLRAHRVWTAYPIAFGSIASTLCDPAVHRRRRDHRARRGLRAARRQRRTRARSRAIDTVFAVSSVLTPFVLGAAVGGIASGRVPVGNAAGDLVTSWLNPTSILIGVLAVASAAYLAAVFLAADAARLGEDDLVEAFRAPRAGRRRRRRRRSRVAGLVVLHARRYRALPRARQRRRAGRR